MSMRLTSLLAAIVMLAASPAAPAQTPPPAAPAQQSPSPPAGPQASPAAPATAPAAPTTGTTAGAIGALDWLAGCWAGEVNHRDFTEQWTRPSAGMMLGLGHTVMGDRTESYEYMRIETRADGSIAYFAKPTDKAEEGFVYQGARDDHGATSYVFSNPARDFPAEIAYTRTVAGELFAYVRGKINGAERQVIYPFRRVDCATGKPQ
jgi:hypothetical protein